MNRFQLFVSTVIIVTVFISFTTLHKTVQNSDHLVVIASADVVTIVIEDVDGNHNASQNDNEDKQNKPHNHVVVETLMLLVENSTTETVLHSASSPHHDEYSNEITNTSTSSSSSILYSSSLVVSDNSYKFLNTESDKRSITTTSTTPEENNNNDNDNENDKKVSHYHGSGKNRKDKLVNKYISYKLVQGAEDYNFTFDPNKNPCKNDPNRTILPILHEKGIADFRISVETNLNIAYIGDSVGMQFSQSLQEAAGAVASSSQVIRYAWGWWHKFSHIAKVRGGGTVAGIRLTGAFLEEMRDCPKKASPRGGGGWMEYDVREMKRLLHRWRNVTSLRNAYAKHGNYVIPCDVDDGGKNGTTNGRTTIIEEACKEDNFDVLVYQLPAGWMHSPNQLLNESISVDIINRTIFDAIKYFAPKTVIIQTIPIINNILSIEEYIAVNMNIMTFVHEFRGNKDITGEITLLVMDLGALSTSLLMHNAIHIHALTNGTRGDTNEDNVTSLDKLVTKTKIQDVNFSFLGNSPSYSDASFLTIMRSLLHQRLDTKNKRQHWSSIISHTCGAFIQPHTTTECSKGNEYTFDGQHWCMDTMGGRIDGVVACLLKCSVGRKGLSYDHDIMHRFLEECEGKCNSKFMTLSPIPQDAGDSTLKQETM